MEVVPVKVLCRILIGKGGEKLKTKYIPEVGQIGSQLDTTFFLFDNCIQNTDNVPIAEYERMLETDETIAVGTQFLILSVLMKLGEYTHENKDIENFVRENFENMQGNLHSACEEILTGLWAGYSGSELVWKAAANKVLLDKIVTYHPRTVLIKVDRETGEYKGLKQWRWFDGSPVDIPIEKAILFTFNKRFGNLYGKSIFKAIRKNWLLKDPILKMWGRALDRFGTPLIAIFTTDEEIDDPDRPGESINQLSYAVRLLERIQNSTGLAFKNGNKEDGTDSRAEVLSAGGSGIGEAFEKAVLYLNKMILRGLLVPSLVFDNEGSGSYALGQTHAKSYDMILSSIYKLLKETLLEQVVRRMIEYNFGKQENFGDFMENKFAEDDLKALADAVSSLTQNGYMSPQQQEDVDVVCEKFNLPKRKVKLLRDIVKTKAENEYNRYPVKDGEEIDDPLRKSASQTA